MLGRVRVVVVPRCTGVGMGWGVVLLWRLKGFAWVTDIGMGSMQRDVWHGTLGARSRRVGSVSLFHGISYFACYCQETKI